MIATTSSGKCFAPLAIYLERGRSGQEIDRVAWIAERNLGTDEPEIAARFMQATANANPRVEKPVYHFSISFDPSDLVSPEQMQRVADNVLKALGMEQHQAFMVAHKDRAHPHVHVMVNRVHPETFLACERWQDRPAIERVLREDERALGLREVRGTLYQASSREQQQGEPTLTENLTAREQRQTQTPFLESVKQHLAELRAAPSWNQLAARLDDHGLRFNRKGQGLVITDGEHEVKASLVARDLSLARLEARFGIRYPADDGHLTAIERQRLSPAVTEIVGALDAHEAGERLRGEHERLSSELRVAIAFKHQLASATERVTKVADDFDRDLARVYHDPKLARERFEQLVTTAGHTRALDTLGERPEQFAALNTVDQKRVLGILIVADDTVARTAATHAVSSARQLFREQERLSEHVRDIVTSTEKSFQNALALLYRNPLKARAAFEEALAHARADAAARQITDRPDVFGALAPASARTDSHGRVRSISESSQLATESACEVVAVRHATSVAAMQAYAQEWIPRLDERARTIQRELAREFDPRLMEQSLARAMQRLAPHEFLELRRALSEPQRAIAAKIRQQVRDVVLGRDEIER